MNDLSINIPDDLREKMEEIAKERGLGVQELFLDVTRAIIREYEAEQRFRERAARGKGREQEALALLRR